VVRDGGGNSVENDADLDQGYVFEGRKLLSLKRNVRYLHGIASHWTREQDGVVCEDMLHYYVQMAPSFDFSLLLQPSLSH
jgi:hypothetical protein